MTQRYPITPFDQIFGDMFGSFYEVSSGNTYPLHDIFVEEDDLVFEFALSGFSKDDLSVELANNILTVQGKKDAKNEVVQRKYLQKKIAERNFKVTYAIPNEYLGQESEVSFVDGILTIVFPKSPEARSKQLAIK